MLKPLHIRQGSRQVEERPRGATRARQSVPQIWREIMSQLAHKIPWGHLSMGLLVALVAGSIPWISGQALAAMDRQIVDISVQGDLHGVAPTALENRLQPWLGRSFFASDLEAVKRSLEQEPWIDTAAVRRVWPDSLVVEVVEHDPVAFWNQNSLLTRKGEVITPDSVAAAGVLPQLDGPADRAQEVLSTARMLSERLAADDLRLASLRQEARGAWTLKLDNGISVELGRDRVEERLTRFLSVYRSHLKVRVTEVEGVDARYSNGIAVRWKNSAQENI